jgi:DNA-binding NarL/FixJ family response regulator
VESKLVQTIQEEIESLKSLIKDYEIVIPNNNHIAKNILATFNDKIKSLESLICENDNSGQTESPLSKRESEILVYVAKGFTNNEIASALRISAKTIEYHMSSIFKKTEASNRTEAVSNALEFKWIQ